jgi:hypothetical protein
MSTIHTTTSNTGLRAQQQVGQMPRKVSPEQDSHRLREAQELLHQLQDLLMDGRETPATDTLSYVMQKTEGLISQIALNPDMDSQTRKVFEDINALLVAARQLGRNKLIGDRLQEISEESQKVLQDIRGPDVSAAAKEATQNLNDFITNWRPLFYLLMSSRDFRQLILDLIRISRRVIYSYTDDISDETSKKFVEGAQAKDIASTAKDIAKQKGTPELSEEEWNLLQDDVQQVLVILSKEPTYRDGIERIFSLLDTFQRYVNQTHVEAEVVPENIHARRVLDETEDLVASFSGKDNFEQFKYHLRILILLTQKNENLQSYLNELKVFILKAKSEQEIRSEEFKQQSRNLATRGREIMSEWREQEDLNRFFDSGQDMIDNIKNDEFLQILRHHAGVVQSDLSFVDTQGNVQVDTDMLSKLQSALLPFLADALKYIPVSKIQSKDNDQEFWLDNVVLCSYDILPENIRFHLEADSEISLRDIEMKNNRTFLVIQLNRLQTELKDIEFYYKKKTFPRFEDHGRATFRIKGEGSRLSFTYKLVQEPQDPIPKIKEGYVSFDISELDIEFDKTTLQHPFMIPMLTTIFKTLIRHQIEKQVENNLNGFIGKLGDMITSSLTIMNRPFMSGIERARKAVKSTPLAQVYEKRREILE